MHPGQQFVTLGSGRGRGPGRYRSVDTTTRNSSDLRTTLRRAAREVSAHASAIWPHATAGLQQRLVGQLEHPIDRSTQRRGHLVRRSHPVDP